MWYERSCFGSWLGVCRTVFFLMMLVLQAACIHVEQSPLPVSGSPAATERPTVAERTVLPAATHTPLLKTPAKTQIPVNVARPMVAAKRLRFDSWSPDAEWIAYWFSSGSDYPAFLGFVHVLTGEICQHGDVVAQEFWDGRVVWQEGARVIVAVGEATFGGMPCEAFSPIEQGIISDAGSNVSPGGRYRARTLSERQGQTLYNTTTITDTTTGEVVITVPWVSSIHALRRGPGWLNSELYLIGQTFDQGVLYISAADGSTGSVLTDLLGMDSRFEENQWWVFSHADPATGEYHILLQWWGGVAQLPLVLYHAELGQFEVLPFYSAWPFDAMDSDPYAFSPDGEWLLVGDAVFEDRPPEAIGEDYWLRPVDSPGSRAIKVGEGLAVGAMSDKAQKIAFYDQRFIYIHGFPDGELLSRWSANDFLMPVEWSPDGKWLAAVGMFHGRGRETLFVIEP